jgi:hypothetical protein
MIQCNSVQFSGYLLRCTLNSTSACYKASTNTQIKHKNSANPQKQNNKQAKKFTQKGNIKEVLGQRPYNLKALIS